MIKGRTSAPTEVSKITTTEAQSSRRYGSK